VTIDRRALVARHAVVMYGIDGASPLSVGNGELCFTVDVTGLQSMPEHYPVADRASFGTPPGPPGTLLGTLSQWGWHSVPGEYDLAATYRTYQTPRGPVPYVDLVDGGDPAARWLRANPHRLDLARIGLVRVAGDGSVRPVNPCDLSDVRQRLDLWTGIITSRFRLCGVPVLVTTACHPHRDVLAVRVESDDDLGVRVAFPYGSQAWGNAADWTRPHAHRTDVRATAGGVRIVRTLDDTAYEVDVDAVPRRLDRHEFLFHAAGRRTLVLSIGFAPAAAGAAGLPTVTAVLDASATARAEFWTGGGAMELAGSRDARAPELERRIVLSQYLTALHCAGHQPPQETGLMTNSWYGRFHLEMTWWHGAHFALWGRTPLLERILGWYTRTLPAARGIARTQGYAGARWPKQVGPDGREGPSPVAPFLIWQQPHPIYLAELARRGAADPARALRRYGDVVIATAEFMADFVVPTPRGYQLGPPLVPAQESYADRRAVMTNPTFELAYWRWALGVAGRWRQALGLSPDPTWAKVAANLVRPSVRDGMYAAVDVPPYTVRDDHPSMLYALGLVPPTDVIDPAVMRATLRKVRDGWPWPNTWGWDYPAMAMTAVRLGDPAAAVDLLMLPTPKNGYLRNGHNRQTDWLPIYLPGNGGLLAAVALMARGSDSLAGGGPAPGFPARDWAVRAEGLAPLP
jgi:hypothetical protein